MMPKIYDNQVPYVDPKLKKYDAASDFSDFTWMSDKDEQTALENMNQMFRAVFPSLISQGMTNSSLWLQWTAEDGLCVELYNERDFGSELKLSKPVDVMFHTLADGCNKDGLNAIKSQLTSIISDIDEAIATLD